MKNIRRQFEEASVRGPILLIGLLMTIGSLALAQTAQTSPKEKPYVVEYYYKAQWGHAEEFLQLYKKNHYPVMKKEQELGRMLNISIVKPRFHATEDGRWDFRVTIVWKNVQVTNDGFDEDKLIRQLYPNQESYKKEEQRRFEILLAHWDVPVVDVDTEN